jgi:hypothetical protein
VSLILPVRLSPGTFFDVDIFSNIKWKYKGAPENRTEIFIQDLQNI